MTRIASPKCTESSCISISDEKKGVILHVWTNICCRPSLEPSPWDASNEGSQLTFISRNNKNHPRTIFKHPIYSELWKLNLYPVLSDTTTKDKCLLQFSENAWYIGSVHGLSGGRHNLIFRGLILTSSGWTCWPSGCRMEGITDPLEDLFWQSVTEHVGPRAVEWKAWPDLRSTYFDNQLQKCGR